MALKNKFMIEPTIRNMCNMYVYIYTYAMNIIKEENY